MLRQWWEVSLLIHWQKEAFTVTKLGSIRSRHFWTSWGFSHFVQGVTPLKPPTYTVGGAGAHRYVILGVNVFMLDLDVSNKDRRARNGTSLYIFLARVVLGRVYVCQSAKQYKRAPCSCNDDKCKDTSHRASAYHSVLGTHKDPSTRLKFREFVVYEKSNSFPEFLIEYVRQWPARFPRHVTPLTI